MALIFHIFFSATTTNVLHIFRKVPSAFCISYLQSTIAVVGFNILIFSIRRVRVPGLLAELFNMPCTEEPMPILHSPVETSWSTSVVRMFFSKTVSLFSLALEYWSIKEVIAFRWTSSGVLCCPYKNNIPVKFSSRTKKIFFMRKILCGLIDVTLLLLSSNKDSISRKVEGQPNYNDWPESQSVPLHAGDSAAFIVFFSSMENKWGHNWQL